MKNFGTVYSHIAPPALVVDEFSVWVATDIARAESGEYSYSLTQYDKDEYIKLMDEKNAELESQLTDTQLALCDVYEMIGG